MIEYDWQKKAAEVTSSNLDTDRAFLDQAWTMVQNKATPLMKPQYRVGFEVVYRNDTNTRLVGVFIFRIDDVHLMVPVFFINGSLKGTDMLYRSNVKRFVPLTNDWCDYLIQSSVVKEGHGVPQSLRRNTRDSLDLVSVVEPPHIYRNMRKYSMEDPVFKQAVEGMFAKAVNTPDATGKTLLQRFIQQHGKRAAIQKLATEVGRNRLFAEALVAAYDEEDYAPELPAEKLASADDPVLTLHLRPVDNQNVKSASAQEIQQGYQIVDFRKDAAETVYADPEQSLESVTEPGVYLTLTQDGGRRRCLFGYSFLPNPGVLDGAVPHSIYPTPWQESRDLVVVDTETGRSNNLTPEYTEAAYGTLVSTLAEAPELKPMESMVTDKAYRIVDVKRQRISSPFTVVGSEQDAAGLKVMLIVQQDRNARPARIMINPDFQDYDPNDYIFGSQCKVVEVAKTMQPSPDSNPYWITYDGVSGLATQSSLQAFVFENTFKRACVQLMPDRRLRLKTAGTQDQWSEPVDDLAAKLMLMCHCGVQETVADDIIKSACGADEQQVQDMAKRLYGSEVNVDLLTRDLDEATGEEQVKLASEQKEARQRWEGATQAVLDRRLTKPFSFLYDGTKQAFNIRFQDWPVFQETMDPDFRVLRAPNTFHVLPTESDPPIIDQHRIGDVWRQEGDGPAANLDTATPMELFSLSQMTGMNSLFDHGVVGSLVKSFDSISMVDTYMPDLEQALDKIARMLFLWYWKPEDFTEAYGTDDQSLLENSLLNCFRSLGELTLTLLQKSKVSNAGNPPALV